MCFFRKLDSRAVLGAEHLIDTETGMFNNMMNTVHINEKWFHMIIIILLLLLLSLRERLLSFMRVSGSSVCEHIPLGVGGECSHIKRGGQGGWWGVQVGGKVKPEQFKAVAVILGSVEQSKPWMT